MVFKEELIEEIKRYCDIYNNDEELLSKLTKIIEESYIDIKKYTGWYKKEEIDFSDKDLFDYKSLLKNLVLYIWNGYTKTEFLHNYKDDISFLKRKNDSDENNATTESI